MKLLHILVVALCWISTSQLEGTLSAVAQGGTIETIAGTGENKDGGEGGSALETPLRQPFNMQVGPDGAMYFCEFGGHRVRRLDLETGQLTSVAGTGQPGYSGDGQPATQAQLNQPHEFVFDGNGNLYVSDMKNHAIRKIDRKTQIISTLAGTGKPGYSGDGGPSNRAQLKLPISVCIRELPGRDDLFIADIGNHRVRVVDLKTGHIETAAGNGEAKMCNDGDRAAVSPLRGPRALCIGDGNLWIAMREGNSLWRMDLERGTMHHVAGSGKSGFKVESGAAKGAEFRAPRGIAFGPDHCVYLADTGNHLIRRVDPAKRTISVVAGQPAVKGFAGDGGPATAATLANPHGIGFGPDRTMYIGDSDNHRIRKVSP